MEVRIKKLDDAAVIPKYAKDGDAGLDLVATSVNWDEESQCWEYDCGLAFEIPIGFVGLVFPRSSISKTDLTLTNSVGVIDSGYRNSVKARFKTAILQCNKYEIGDRFAQLIILPYPKISFIKVEDLTPSKRGLGGFGSSGK